MPAELRSNNCRLAEQMKATAADTIVITRLSGVSKTAMACLQPNTMQSCHHCNSASMQAADIVAYINASTCTYVCMPNYKHSRTQMRRSRSILPAALSMQDQARAHDAGRSPAAAMMQAADLLQTHTSCMQHLQTMLMQTMRESIACMLTHAYLHPCCCGAATAQAKYLETGNAIPRSNQRQQ